MKHIHVAQSLVMLTMILISTTMANSPMLFTGAIQFPKDIQNVPSITILSKGSYLVGNPDDVSKRFIYSVNRSRSFERFWLIVTVDPKPVYVKGTNNTVDFWKIADNKPYKLYSLALVLDELPEEENGNKTATPSIRWDIQEHELPEDRRVPDKAIIVYCDPLWVDSLEGTNPLELPTIKLSRDLTKTFGSEQALHDCATCFNLASMDLRPFFTPIEYEIKQDNKQLKKIIALANYAG